MAQLLHADGRSEIVAPANGESFTLQELQRYVGGYIEAIYLRDGCVMLVNEEAKLREPIPPLNRAATALFWNSGGSVFDCVVGPAILVSRREAGEDDDEY